VDEVGGADNGKAKREKQSCEGKERHGEGTRGWCGWPELDEDGPHLCMWVEGRKR